MYAVDRYVSVNDYGTAVLFQALIDRPVRRVVVASSMSIYGEGLYRTADGDARRGRRARRRAAPGGSWDPLDAEGRPLDAGADARDASGPTLRLGLCASPNTCRSG